MFSLQEVPESLGLQEVYDLAIDFTPVDLESYTADLVIRSNDDENPEYTVSLTGIGGLGPLARYRTVDRCARFWCSGDWRGVHFIFDCSQ